MELLMNSKTQLTTLIHSLMLNLVKKMILPNLMFFWEHNNGGKDDFMISTSWSRISKMLSKILMSSSDFSIFLDNKIITDLSITTESSK